jgi:hypothetical protein
MSSEDIPVSDRERAEGFRGVRGAGIATLGGTIAPLVDAS